MLIPLVKWFNLLKLIAFFLKNRKVGSKRKLSIKEEFVLPLTRIRRGFDVEVLGDIFGVHSSVVSRIFTTWIKFLYLELNFLISWPTRGHITTNLPNVLYIFQRQDPLLIAQNFLFKILAYLHLRELHGLSINIIIYLKHWSLFPQQGPSRLFQNCSQVVFQIDAL